MTDLSQLTDEQLLALQPQPVTVRPLPPPQGVNSYGLPYASPSPSSQLDLSHLTPDQLGVLQAQAANNNPNMSPLEDVGRSTLTGVEKGLTSIAGLPGDLRQLGGGIVNFTARQTARAMGKDPGAAQVFDPNAISPTDVLNPGLLAAHLAPTSQRLNAPLQSGFHTPQTPAGDYAQRIGEFAPTAAMPGGIAARIARVLVPGAASEFAENRVSEPYKPLASALGALVGGGVVGGAEKIALAPQASFGAAMGDLSDKQIALAQALRVDAGNRGITLTLPEAVQQVTDNGTGLGRLQRVVEGTKRGQSATTPYFANRPKQVAEAVHGYLDTIAPPTDLPSAIGLRGKDAAQAGLDKVRGVINDAAGPDYQALVGQTVPADAYAPLKANAAYGHALAEVRADPILNAGLAHLPDEDLSVMNEVVKRLDRNVEASKQTATNPSGDNARAASFQEARTLADKIAGGVSDNWRQARDIVASGRGAFLNPLEAGPVGKVATTTDVPTQTSALYPSNPLEGAPSETAQAVRVLDNSDAGVSSDLTRQHLARAINQATRDLQSGQNQYGGSRFAVSVAGNPEQASTLRAGVSALPEGDAKAADLDNLLQALRATGKRQPPGSMTAFNTKDLSDFGITPAVKFMQSLNIAEPLEPISNAIAGVNYRRNVDGLVKMMLANPDETAAILDTARKAAGKPGAGALVPALLAAPKDRKP